MLQCNTWIFWRLYWWYFSSALRYLSQVSHVSVEYRGVGWTTVAQRTKGFMLCLSLWYWYWFLIVTIRKHIHGRCWCVFLAPGRWDKCRWAILVSKDKLDWRDFFHAVWLCDSAIKYGGNTLKNTWCKCYKFIPGHYDLVQPCHHPWQAKNWKIHMPAL